MSSESLLHASLIQALGSILLHACWQGMVIAGAYWVVVRYTRIDAPERRYRMALMAMFLLATVPLFTFAWHCHSSLKSSDMGSIESPTLVAGNHVSHDEPVLRWNEIGNVLPSSAILAWLSSHIGPIRAVTTFVWCIGQMVGGVQILYSLGLVRKLRQSSEETPAEVAEMTRRLSVAMGIRHQPIVRATRDLTDAAAIGLWRGCVLIPIAWLTELSPQMLEAVIAHELSHLRRHDAWLMLFQRLIELAYFFHPAVWWLSRELRESREQCCDQEAITVIGDRLLYGRLLEWAARFQLEVPVKIVPQLGDDRMSLLNRIRRVLGEPVTEQSGRCWAAGLLALVVPLFCTAASKTQAQSNTRSNHQSSVAAPDAAFYSIIKVTDDGTDETAVRFPLQAGMSVRDALAAAKIEEYSLVQVERSFGPTRTLKRTDIETAPEARFDLQPSDRLRVICDDETSSISFEEAGKVVSQYGRLLRQHKTAAAERFIHHLTEAQRAHPVVQVLVDHAAAREQAKNPSSMCVRCYDVRKFVTPVSQRPPDEDSELLPTAATADFETLVELITQTIEPKSWSIAGGEAAIKAFPTNHFLVIKQTQEGHDAVSALLRRLSEVQDKAGADR